MKATIVIMQDGKISVVTREGTFTEGRKRIERLLEALNVDGLNVEPVSDEDFERHRHDYEKVSVAQARRQGVGL